MKNFIKSLLLVLAFGSSAVAAPLQPVELNDPVFNELTDGLPEETSENDPRTGEMLGAIRNTLVNDAATDENNNPLLETPVNNIAAAPAPRFIPAPQPQVKKFHLSDSDEALTEKISQQISEPNITVSNLNFKRVGGNKIFGFEQVKKIVLKTSFSIENIDIDKDSGEFTSIVKPQIGTYEIEVRGRFAASTKMPVIARTVSKGSVITQDDIEFKNYPKEKITDENVVNINEIIGKSANKLLTKGMAITKNDVKDAVTIRKNKTVSAIYKNDTIEVKALAIAQEDGSPGDVIKLKNYDSGKEFKAVVQADGTVAIELNNNNLSLNDSTSINVN